MSALLLIVRRIGTAALTLFAVSIVVFVAVRLLPGNYAELVLGPLASDEAKATATAELGLDQNIAVQYLAWMARVLQGDLGSSFVSGIDVTTEFAERLPVTATIALGAGALTVLIGVPLGVLTATRATGARGGLLGRVVSAIGISVPEFVLGGVIVFVVSTLLPSIQIGGYMPIGTDPAAFFGSLALPMLVLSVFCIATTARTTRDAVLGVLVEPHVTAAVARGESRGFIIRHHVLRNAAVPVLTLLATIIATLMGGTVIVESIFNVPGIGSYLVTALGRRDYVVIQAGVLLAAAAFIVSSIVIDAVAAVVDPRLSEKEASA